MLFKIISKLLNKLNFLKNCKVGWENFKIELVQAILIFLDLFQLREI